jgi:hypothetical protein
MRAQNVEAVRLLSTNPFQISRLQDDCKIFFFCIYDNRWWNETNFQGLVVYYQLSFFASVRANELGLHVQIKSIRTKTLLETEGI